MHLRLRSTTTPPQWGQMALSGAVLEAVTGCWLLGCWATFIVGQLSLLGNFHSGCSPACVALSYPVYGRLPPVAINYSICLGIY
jgi:hypothetical protein